MALFEREIRYVVIKLKDLDDDQKEVLYDTLELENIPQRESVVIESSNPLYEKVWDMIKEQVENG